MALKILLEIIVLASTIGFALAEYECRYLDGRNLYCDSCCEYDCCTVSTRGSGGGSNTDVGGLVAAVVGGVVGGSAIIVFISICVRRKCLASRGGIVVHQPSDVMVVSCIASPVIAGRPMYNPNVPQTGTYDYEQPTAFATSRSGYIPIKKALGTAPPRLYIL